MKPFVCIAVIVVCGLYACESKPKKRGPAILEGKSVDVSSLKREQYDLVERLYYEMADTTADLKEIELLLKELKKSKIDSLKGFENFDEKNSLYYNTVIRKLQGIQDMALRSSIKSILDTNLTAYKQQAADWKALNDSITKKQALINDLYIVLKLSRTAAFMNKYQQEYIPAISQGKAVSDNMDSIISRLDSLIKK